jgi:predicted phage baseplate assembly protein
MEFDFLPKLPKSNLDDRTFDDLMDEALLRIPRYCPEWTNYNPSDPGVTLIELFAWMTEQMLQRFNQVPQRNYVAFLELLGIRLQPPVPAQTDLTFYLNTALPEPHIIPGGIEVATLRTETEAAIVFSTDQPLVIGTPRLAHFLTAEMVEDVPQTLRDRFSDILVIAFIWSWMPINRLNPMFWRLPFKAKLQRPLVSTPTFRLAAGKLGMDLVGDRRVCCVRKRTIILKGLASTNSASEG